MPDPHRITVERIDDVTPDVRRYTCTRPEGYEFTPGQATEVALDVDGWRDERRPFTFTSLPADPHLEFTIKSYPDHDGVTEQLGRIEPGAGLLIGDAWGAIEDKGAGTFIAGGAGVTPFLAILRQRRERDDLAGCHLIFSNRTEADIIERAELEAMKDLRTSFLVTEQDSSPMAAEELDESSLAGLIDDVDQPFYVCGPPPMVDAISAALESMGASPDGITFEE